MRIVFDNNIWISFLIGKRLAELRPVFNRKDVEIYYCDELEQEFLEVAHRPKIMKYVDEKQIGRPSVFEGRLVCLLCGCRDASALRLTSGTL